MIGRAISWLDEKSTPLLVACFVVFFLGYLTGALALGGLAIVTALIVGAAIQLRA